MFTCRLFPTLLCVAFFHFPARGTVGREEPVELNTRTGTIYGTLRLPAVPFRSPLVLFISGSGPKDRNGNSAVPGGDE